MAFRHRPGPEGDVGLGLRQPGRRDDLAGDPVGIGLSRDRLDDEAEQAEAVIGIFQALRARENRRPREIGEQLVLAQIGLAIEELARVYAVPQETGAVGKQLGQRHRRNVWVQALDIGAGPVVEPQAPLLDEAQGTRSGEALRMRGDAEAVARRQRLAGCKIGAAERSFQHDLALAGDRDRATGLVMEPALEFEPACDIVERGGQPGLHRGIHRRVRRERELCTADGATSVLQCA